MPHRFHACASVLLLISALHAQDERATLARKLVDAGDPVRAIPEFIQAVEASPSNAGLWTELGEARLAAGQTRPAISDLSRAVKLEPSSVRAQKSLATAVEKSGNPQRALIEWRRLSQISDGADRDLANSHVSTLLETLGLALPSEKPHSRTAATATTPAPKPAAAPRAPIPNPKESVKKAAKETPDLQKALDAWKAGKRDEALEAIRTIVRAHPTPEAWYWGGVMRFEEKSWDKADFNLKKAVDDPKLSGKAWYWLGRSAEAQGKSAATKEAYRKSLQKEPAGEFVADIKARLEPTAKDAKPTKSTDAAIEAPAVVHEETPPVLPDSLRDAWTWNAPTIAIPAADASPAGKLLEDAARQLKAGQNDLALSSIESIKMKYPGTPAADLAQLATAIANLAMGLPPLALTNAREFLKDHPDHPRVRLARFVSALALLRIGHADSATSILAAFHPEPNDGWTEAAHQSAIAQGLRQQKRFGEAASALRQAFQAEKDNRAKRSLALRAVRDNKAAGTPVQALPMVVEARKSCDKGGACMHLAVAQADLEMLAGNPAQAIAGYQQVARDWPSGPETPWALYQTGTAQLKLRKPAEAAAAWKVLVEKHPGSYWASQARLRLEDALWRAKYKETLQ